MSKRRPRKFCPSCGSPQQTKVKPFTTHDSYNMKDRNFRKSFGKNEELTINYFARKCECQTCGHIWVTSEFPINQVFSMISKFDTLVKENEALRSNNAEYKLGHKNLQNSLEKTTKAYGALMTKKSSDNVELNELKAAMATFVKYALAPQSNKDDNEIDFSSLSK